MVFIVDDDASVRKSLERLVRSVGLRGETFASAPSSCSARPLMVRAAWCWTCAWPGVSGLVLQERLAAVGHRIPIIIITGHGDIYHERARDEGRGRGFLAQTVQRPGSVGEPFRRQLPGIGRPVRNGRRCRTFSGE